MKDETEAQLFVTLVFFSKLLLAAARDEITNQPFVIKREIRNYAQGAEKDEIGRWAKAQ